MNIEHVTDAQLDAEAESEILGHMPRIPEGTYWLRYMYHETLSTWDRPKVAIHFAIVDDEMYEGVELVRYNNVAEIKGKPRKYGQFAAKPAQEIVREFVQIVGRSERLERMTPYRYRKWKILGQVATVKRDGQRRTLDEANQYSTIRRLVTGLRLTPKLTEDGANGQRISLGNSVTCSVAARGVREEGGLAWEEGGRFPSSWR